MHSCDGLGCEDRVPGSLHTPQTYPYTCTRLCYINPKDKPPCFILRVCVGSCGCVHAQVYVYVCARVQCKKTLAHIKHHQSLCRGQIDTQRPCLGSQQEHLRAAHNPPLTPLTLHLTQINADYCWTVTTIAARTPHRPQGGLALLSVCLYNHRCEQRLRATHKGSSHEYSSHTHTHTHRGALTAKPGCLLNCLMLFWRLCAGTPPVICHHPCPSEIAVPKCCFSMSVSICRTTWDWVKMTWGDTIHTHDPTPVCCHASLTAHGNYAHVHSQRQMHTVG